MKLKIIKEKFLKLISPIKEPLWEFIKKVRSDSLDSISAQIAFFIVIAFIPFVMIVLSIFQIININGISLLNSVIKFLPKTVGDFVLGLFPENLELFTSISIAAIACLWSSSIAMRAFLKGINRVFGSTYRKGFIWMRLIALLYTVVFAVILVFSAVILIFGNTLYQELHKFIPWHFVPVLIDFKSILIFLLLTVFFTLSYYFIPFKIKYSFKNCLAGASFASAGWVLFSFFFSLFVENNARYSLVYGSLATLVIFMFWLYFCMYILFLGGEIAVSLEIHFKKNNKNIKKDVTK